MSDDPDQPGPARQREIYMEGIADITPDIPVAYEALEAAAHEALDPQARDYVAGGAGGERTIDHNRAAFEEWRLLPRVLTGVADRDLGVELFGTEWPAPIALAPIGVLSIVDETAERGVATTARELGLPMVLSSASSETLETVAGDLGLDDATDGGIGWFQLYWPTDDDLTKSFVDRAEAAGYEVLVVTVDTPMLAWRERDIQRAYLPFLDGEGVANYFADPVFRGRLDESPEDNEFVAIDEFVDVFGDPSLTWSDLEWLCEYTDLPVVVKGVCHPGDAEAAVEHGAAGVVVSNHGGRQVDNAVPALDALPAVVEAVEEETVVLYDSGIRRGADVLVALALGAEAVLMGRPYVYGLALDGPAGVEAVCRNLLADLDLSLGLCGREAVADVDRSMVTRATSPSFD